MSVKKRILFIVQPIIYRNAVIRHGPSAGWQPLLGPACVAAAARKAGHTVKILDTRLSGGGEGAVKKAIRSFRPDVVGISSCLYALKNSLNLARLVKSVNPGAFVVLGGPITTVFPGECARSPQVDAVVIGEGEMTFLCLLDALGNPGRLKRVKGIWFKDGRGKVVENPRRPLIADLDSLPDAALELYPLKESWLLRDVFKRRAAGLIGSRGCPYKCTFCSSSLTFGKRIRFRKPERLTGEMDSLRRRAGLRSFVFYDDIFTMDRERTVRFCRLLVEDNSRYSWGCCTRTDRIDPELLGLMKKAGCILMMFGCESGSQRLLDRMKKDVTLAGNYEGIAMARKAGITTAAGFMIGLPTETREETAETLRFARRAGLDYAWFNMVEPYPGTGMWDDAVENGYFVNAGGNRISGKDFNPAGDSNAVWVPSGRTRKELRKWLNAAASIGKE